MRATTIRFTSEPVPYYDMLRQGELIAEEAARRSQRDTQVLIEHLEGLAVASHVEPRTTSERAVKAAIVQRGPFRAALHRRARAARVRAGRPE